MEIHFSQIFKYFKYNHIIKMNLMVTLVVLLLVLYTLSIGMIWAAIGLALVLVVLSFTGRSTGVARKPMFYKSDRNVPIGPMNEQTLRVYFQDEWSGYEDDDEYANAIGEGFGSGIGRGIGFLR
jgi:hypothetical protein